LESKEVLYTYEISIDSKDDFLGGRPVFAERKQDHRKIYLDYEGLISGNRGLVQILWKGHYRSFPFQKKMNIFLENRKIVVHIN
jgi:hypothetical protein